MRADMTEASRVTEARYDQALLRYEEALDELEAGRLVAARRGLESALAAFETLGETRCVGLCWNWLGQICDLEDRPREALACYERSLEAFRAAGDRQGEGSTLGSSALAYLALAQFDQASDRAYQALSILREVGDRQGEEATLGNLGNIYATMGDYETARIIISSHWLSLAKLATGLMRLPRFTISLSCMSSRASGGKLNVTSHEPLNCARRLAMT